MRQKLLILWTLLWLILPVCAIGQQVINPSASGANPAGSGSELQYRSNGTTFGAVTGSSVSGANISLGGSIDMSINSSTAASLGNATYGGNKIVFSNSGAITILSSSTAVPCTIQGLRFALAPYVNDGGAVTTFTITPATNTTQTLSTNIPDIVVSAYTKQWATGALTLQEFQQYNAPTISFVAASTCTTATNGSWYSPKAGTNCTLTNSYAGLFTASAAGHIPLVIQGAASQSGNLMNILSSTGVVYSYFDSIGGLEVDSGNISLFGGQYLCFSGHNSTAQSIKYSGGAMRFAGGNYQFDGLINSNATSTAGAGNATLTLGASITSPPTTLGNSRYFSIINAHGSVNERQEIGFGYSNAATYLPGVIGFLTTSASGNTNGSLYFATRTLTTDSAPILALTLDSSQNATFGGLSIYPSTLTGSGTTGNQTINKPSGSVRIAAAGNTVTVTDSYVTTSSIVLASIASSDATAYVKEVVPSAGSFVININACTAETEIRFVVFNN